MTRLRDIATKVRSKNAGPFWLTIDIFCPDEAAFMRTRDGLTTAAVAAALNAAPADIKRFDIADLHVIKFSLPRPTVQGDPADRDMHGAGWAPLIASLPLTGPRHRPKPAT